MYALLRFSLSSAIVFSIVAFAVADDPASKPSAGKQTPEKKDGQLSATEIKALVQRLDSGKYKERNDATNKLMTGGKAVIDPVLKAGLTDDIELGARCFDILRHFYEKGNATTKAAAEAALKKMQASGHKAVAKWAAEALAKPAANQAFPFGGQRFGGRIRIVGPNNLPPRVRMPQFPAGGGNRQITSRTVNGRRELTAREGNRTVRISDTNGRNIAIKVTETKKGKSETKEYKAKDEAELKKKHPDGAKIYEQYKNFGRMNLNGRLGGGFFGGRPLNAQPAQPPAAGNARVKREIAKAQSQLDAVAKQLQKHAAQKNAKPDELKRLAEQLQQARQALQRATRQLR